MGLELGGQGNRKNPAPKIRGSQHIQRDTWLKGKLIPQRNDKPKLGK